MVRRIDEGIERHRKSDGTIRWSGPGKGPVQIGIEQTKSSFLFGTTLFMLGGFDDSLRNRVFERTLIRALTFAVFMETTSFV